MTPIQLSSLERDDLRAAFDLFDTQKTGRIALAHLVEILHELPPRPTTQLLLQRLADEPKDAMLDFEEFCARLTTDSNETDYLRKVFDLFDTDKKGYIDEQDLRAVADDLGESMTDEELQEMLRRASDNGQVTYEEFASVMNRKLF